RHGGQPGLAVVATDPAADRHDRARRDLVVAQHVRGQERGDAADQEPALADDQPLAGEHHEDAAEDHEEREGRDDREERRLPRGDERQGAHQHPRRGEADHRAGARPIVVDREHAADLVLVPARSTAGRARHGGSSRGGVSGKRARGPAAEGRRGGTAAPPARPQSSSVSTSVTAATPASSAANSRVSVEGRAFADSGPPSTPPTAEPAAKTRVVAQSTCTSVPRRASRLVAVAMIMTSRLVPEARRIASPSAITSMGTTMNPPPTPKKPVRKPVSEAAAITTPRRGEGGGAGVSGRSGSPWWRWRPSAVSTVSGPGWSSTGSSWEAMGASASAPGRVPSSAASSLSSRTV